VYIASGFYFRLSDPRTGGTSSLSRSRLLLFLNKDQIRPTNTLQLLFLLVLSPPRDRRLDPQAPFIPNLFNSNLKPFYVSSVSCKLSIWTIRKRTNTKNKQQPVRMWKMKQIN